jgi:glycosyltransferase involved in cell wall biosynthesis
MRLALVVQRYGTEVLGGAEFHCRLLAEKWAAQHDVEVLTTCARDYITWENAYAEGADRIRGVTVRRFPTTQTRNITAFNEYSEWIFSQPHSSADEMEWLKRQGPWAPGLIEYLRSHQQQYDAIVFFTYLYATTVLGLEICPERSVLVPTTHDEPAVRLGIYKKVFAAPAAIMYNTEIERRFVHDLFAERPLLEEVVGVGVDLPPSPFRGTPAANTAGAEGGDAAPAEETERFPSHLLLRGAVFRRRHRLHGPILLYGGRIDPGKGCEELIEYFSRYVKDGGHATLTLMGVKLMPLPEDPSVRFAGLLSDRERFEALEASTVVVCPSPYESLSLLALEAFAVGTPVLANAQSAVLVEHCRTSNAGLYYADGDEFIECVKLLTGDARLREAMGRNGRDYIRRNYRWDVVLGKYERTFAKLRNAR